MLRILFQSSSQANSPSAAALVTGRRPIHVEHDT
jgi:hypothetical protein